MDSKLPATLRRQDAVSDRASWEAFLYAKSCSQTKACPCIVWAKDLQKEYTLWKIAEDDAQEHPQPDKPKEAR